jgi:Na+/pantothenate symporter
MKLVKNEIQKQNLSKLLYDIVKIIFGTVIIFQIIRPNEFEAWIFISGLITMISAFFWAYILDGKEMKK